MRENEQPFKCSRGTYAGLFDELSDDFAPLMLLMIETTKNSFKIIGKLLSIQEKCALR